jgi:hypothetical protein
MSAPLGLHICFRAQGFKWPLRDDDDVQVWTAGHELVATLPARVIRHLVELHLAGAAMQDEIGGLLRRPPGRPPARAIVVKPYVRSRRDALRVQRRRKGK